MAISTNSHLLVLRRDTATGLCRVGFHAELPLGRFEHIELICETDSAGPITAEDPRYAIYRTACQSAEKLNQSVLAQQQQANLQQGWLSVPLDLDDDSVMVHTDEFGCYAQAAQQALHRLTRNVTEVWAVITDNTVQRIRSRYPPREMEMLEYQVWKQHQLAQLSVLPGKLLTGKLVVRESGLWLAPDQQ